MDYLRGQWCQARPDFIDTCGVASISQTNVKFLEKYKNWKTARLNRMSLRYRQPSTTNELERLNNDYQIIHFVTCICERCVMPSVTVPVSDLHFHSNTALTQFHPRVNWLTPAHHCSRILPPFRARIIYGCKKDCWNGYRTFDVCSHCKETTSELERCVYMYYTIVKRSVLYTLFRHWTLATSLIDWSLGLSCFANFLFIE